MYYPFTPFAGLEGQHIGRGRYCLFLQKGFARTSLERMSVNNVRAFLVYMYNDNINHLKVAPVTNLG